jgi:hypothetical protein
VIDIPTMVLLLDALLVPSAAIDFREPLAMARTLWG